jgi:hypothetical protein
VASGHGPTRENRLPTLDAGAYVCAGPDSHQWALTIEDNAPVLRLADGQACGGGCEALLGPGSTDRPPMSMETPVIVMLDLIAPEPAVVLPEGVGVEQDTTMAVLTPATMVDGMTADEVTP